MEYVDEWKMRREKQKLDLLRIAYNLEYFAQSIPTKTTLFFYIFTFNTKFTPEEIDVFLKQVRVSKFMLIKTEMIFFFFGFVGRRIKKIS